MQFGFNPGNADKKHLLFNLFNKIEWKDTKINQTLVESGKLQ